jgi:hypothetical protein
MAMSLAADGDLAKARALLTRSNIGVFGEYLSASLDGLFDPSPEAVERAILRLRRQHERTGRVTIDLLAFAVHRGHGDEAFELARNSELGPAAGDRSNTGGGESNLAILFMYGIRGLRTDRRFVELCARLRLADYWLATGSWPDCVDEVAPYYDFETEGRRAMEARR